MQDLYAVVQIQLRKGVLDNADCAALTRQHELDHTDHTDHADHTDHTDQASIRRVWQI